MPGTPCLPIKNSGRHAHVPSSLVLAWLLLVLALLLAWWGLGIIINDRLMAVSRDQSNGYAGWALDDCDATQPKPGYHPNP